MTGGRCTYGVCTCSCVPNIYRILCVCVCPPLTELARSSSSRTDRRKQCRNFLKMDSQCTSSVVDHNDNKIHDAHQLDLFLFRPYTFAMAAVNGFFFALDCIFIFNMNFVRIMNGNVQNEMMMTHQLKPQLLLFCT